MRRGGRSLYALDVTDRMAPKLMWRIQGGVDDGFSALAQTWSDPRVGRMMVDGSPTTVLVFGGGYDNENQDSVAANAGRISDDKGHSLYIVRAQDGRLLWSAGGHDSGTSFHVSNMRNSIAASVKLKDFNEDGLTDIIYAADLAGQVFRFDVSNPGSGTFSIDGGMIASLGGADLANNRKFFNEPDVVLVARDGHAYWAINIGSGDRERPISNRDTANWLFSIKDPYVFSAPSNYDYGITMDSLYDITDTLRSRPVCCSCSWRTRTARWWKRRWWVAATSTSIPAAAAWCGARTGMSKPRTRASSKGHDHERIPGFTLIELLIALVIVAVLAAIAVPNYREHVKKAHRARAVTFIKQYQN